jgi:hypothetical protein
VSTPNRPQTIFCTLAELEHWLRADYGIGDKTTAKLISNGAIKGNALPGTTKKRYSPAQIERDVLSGLLAAESRK